MITCTFSLALINTFVSYSMTNHIVTQTAVERLQAEGRLFADKFQYEFSAIRSDALVLKEASILQRIIRSSRASDRIIPASGGKLEDLKAGLAVAFGTFLRARPHYTQLRLIGLQDNGRELVRVDSDASGIHVIPATDLQAKGQEPYILILADLAPGAFYVSPITLNRENGVVAKPNLPTMRLVQPLKDDNGELFGAIVINVDYEAFLRNAMPDSPPSVQITALNQNGDALVFGPNQAAPEFAFHLDETSLAQSQIKDFSGLTSSVSVSQGTASILIPVSTGSTHSPFSFGVVASLPTEKFLAPVRQVVRDTTIWSIMFILISTLVAALFARLLTTPLQRLREEILNPTDNRAPIEAVLSSRDEVGDLARAFLNRNNALIGEANQARAILSSTADGVLTMDHTGRLHSINPSGIRMFGLHTLDFAGWHISKLMPDWPDANIAEKGGDTGVVGQAGSHEFLAHRQDGTTFPVDVALSHFRIGDAAHLAAIVRDMTDREEHLAELNTLIGALKRSNSELDSFAYVASHDLKAPLRVIDNASLWIEEDLKHKLDPDSRENLALIRNRINRMERLLDDLLEHSRIGRKGSEVQMVSGSDLFEEVRDLLPVTSGIMIEVGPEFDKIAMPVVPMRSILQNLLGNAIKHHDRATGRVILEVRVKSEALCFTVSDDGPGIPPKYHEKVFGLFQTLRPRDEVEGSGMGLAMVKKNVEVFGGTLHLISDGARGTTFEFTIPKFWLKASTREEAA
ncbi:hypothetical protein P775_21660 [Puniceibacterium antarcticum]|uniref:histidine kinase n=2 Tax=Puniceibacterium antarcticum TaxID=1206336 RepID=A0A2G8R9A6_9RHOB|nr:hypothetical protein P775_21660 [Puniceibacterium antarcticum]